MVAKLVAWGSDRDEAIDRLRRALSEFVVKGIKTSIPFHLRVLRHPLFRAGHYDTGFIEQHMAGGRGGEAPDGESRRVAHVLAAIAAYRRDKQRSERISAAASPGPVQSGWKSFGLRSQMRGGLR
jgi:acetyl/propionyl-CoA carboxylase alpha subunit